MLQLKEFQVAAARTISKRYAFFANHPERPSRGPHPRPFFQALSAITGAGKTPILAQAVTDLRALVDGEPIVFWMSRAKSVVAQTYANFSDGGKYCEIIDGFKVITIPQLSPELISDGTTPLLILATTGLFNQEDQEEGGLNIYKKGADKFGEKSAWERLIDRNDSGKKRPMVIVYDEGHNFSDQQANLLKQLDPDAYLVASATLKLPEAFERDVLRHIQLWFESTCDSDKEALTELEAVDSKARPSYANFITTSVRSESVVKAELIKRAIQFDGTTANMEQSLDSLVGRMQSIEQEISLRKLGFLPKAIYVCNTNMVDGERDDHTQMFQLRKAAPIRIWRYLVEDKKIDPKTIAVYANLKFAEGNKPDEFRLFSKKESDFDDFTAGNYRHIIFNQALQEGWDDPACYLAYIDKSMGSSIQVEQIIGRVLRQYGAKHYDAPSLNSAHFFLRVDDESVFTKAISEVKKKLQSQGAPLEIVESFGGGKSAGHDIEPRSDISVELCKVNVDADDACDAIRDLLAEFPVFQEGDGNSVAAGKVAKQEVELTALTSKLADTTWEVQGHTNPVRLRWLIGTALRARSTRALAVTDLQDSKFDVRVQIQSIANKQAEAVARDIVSAYYQHSELVYASESSFIFGSMRVPQNAPTFKNSLYEQYGGLNKFELPFAEALDESGHPWHRNPSAGGFHIPLLTEGDTGAFYPDFIVWKGNLVYCLDTKGQHLLTDAIARKLFDIHEDGKIKLHVRFISEGKQTVIGGKAVAGGYTIWKMKAGAVTPIHVTSLTKAVGECLK